MCLYKNKISEMSFAPWGEDRGILMCYMLKAVATNAGTVFRTAEGAACSLDQLENPLEKPASLSHS